MRCIGCSFDFVNKISGSPCTTELGQAGLVVVPSKDGGEFGCTPFDNGNTTFAIRCCADEEAPHITTSSTTCEDLGFPVTELAARPDICGASQIDGTCFTNGNYSQAKQFCEDAGARLCTFGELVSEAGKQSGYGLVFLTQYDIDNSSGFVQLPLGYPCCLEF